MSLSREKARQEASCLRFARARYGTGGGDVKIGRGKDRSERLVFSGMTRLVTLALLFCVLPARMVDAEAVEVPTNAAKPYVHKYSGISFPPAIGAFQRGAATRYDEDGKDISVGYEAPEFLIGATVYVAPAYVPLDHRFGTVKADITHVHRDAKLVSEARWERVEADGRKINGLKAVYAYNYEFAGEQRDLLSEAYLLKLGRNFVLYRITYPADRRLDAMRQVGRFLAGLDLPAPRESRPPAATRPTK
jgi:hypothetical protein